MADQRVQGRVFGEVADVYDDVRPGYPVEILDRIVAYAGRVPSGVVEIGAGTGKATVLLRGLGVPVTCVEPDPAMSALLARRFAGDPLVSVVTSRFEDWRPPAGGVELLAAAQMWRWIDPVRRVRLARDALVAGGVVALFGHRYEFADDETAAALNAVYLRIAPEISAGPVRQGDTDALGDLDGLFGDLQEQCIVAAVPFETARYLALLSTFSPHRMLPAGQRERLHEALGAVIDERGGVLAQRLTTRLWLGRAI